MRQPAVLSTSSLGAALRLLSPNAAPRRGLFLMITSALGAICATFAVVMLDARSEVRHAAETAGLNLATALAQDLGRNIDLLDLSIQAARDSWVVPRIRALDPELRQMVVFDHSATARYVDAILVLGPDGEVLADSRSAVPRQLNLGGEDFFKAQVDHDAGLFVSGPMRWDGTTGWSMAFSRRMTGSDGRFAGVAVGFLDLDYLGEAYKRLPLGDGGILALLNTDGTMLIREPPVPRAIGSSFRGQAAFETMRVQEDGALEGRSHIDGRRRIFAFHRVGTLPLVQCVAEGSDAVYAEWRRKALTIGGVLALLCSGTLALLFALKHELAQRAAAEAALERLASRDALTGLLNRRRFFELAEARCAEATRTGSKLSVLMIDADHFKRYNDRYGHLAGDAVLVGLARCIFGEVRREADLVARFGGEEFIALLPRTDGPQALSIAEAIRAAVTRLAMPGARGAEAVTVSIGIASSIPGEELSLATLVERADIALYRSKHDGRNRSTAGGGAAPSSLALSA